MAREFFCSFISNVFGTIQRALKDAFKAVVRKIWSFIKKLFGAGNQTANPRDMLVPPVPSKSGNTTGWVLRKKDKNGDHTVMISHSPAKVFLDSDAASMNVSQEKTKLDRAAKDVNNTQNNSTPKATTALKNYVEKVDGVSGSGCEDRPDFQYMKNAPGGKGWRRFTST